MSLLNILPAHESKKIAEAVVNQKNINRQKKHDDLYNKCLPLAQSSLNDLINYARKSGSTEAHDLFVNDFTVSYTGSTRDEFYEATIAPFKKQGYRFKRYLNSGDSPAFDVYWS